jgi:hypothetical protein
MQINKISQLRLSFYRKRIRLFSYAISNFSNRTKETSSNNWRSNDSIRHVRKQIKTQSELTTLIMKNKTFTENKKFKLNDDLMIKSSNKREFNETAKKSPSIETKKTNAKYIQEFFSNSDINESKIVTLENLVRKPEVRKPIQKSNSQIDTKINEEKSHSLPKALDLNLDREELAESEKDFLSKASFKVRNDLLDENGMKLLKTFTSLSSQSMDPIHLTILHESFSTRLSRLLYEKIFESDEAKISRNIFIEYNPGFGLITRKLIEILNKSAKTMTTKQKFLLIEPLGKFTKHLEEIKTINEEKFDVKLIKVNPYEQGFLNRTTKFKYGFINDITQSQPIAPMCKIAATKNDTETTESVRMSIFGTVPWNTKGFINSLFSDYASNRGLFGLSQTKLRNYFFHEIQGEEISNRGVTERKILLPEFYFYVPEITLAKLRAGYVREYFNFNSPLSVFSYAFSKIEVLDEEKCDFFFPYPIMSKKYLSHKKSYNLNMKKMFLVKIKFHEDKSNLEEEKESLFGYKKSYSGLIRDKKLFFLFINHLFSRPTDPIRNPFKSICKNESFVCKETQINSYTPVKTVPIYKLVNLYNYLLDNKEVSNLNNLLNHYEVSETNSDDQTRTPVDEINKKKDKVIRKLNEGENKINLNILKDLNKNLSGQFLIPFNENIFGNKESSESSDKKLINRKDTGITRREEQKSNHDDYDIFSPITVKNFS